MSYWESKAEVTENHRARMFDLITAFRVSQIVHCAALFSFADHLSGGPSSAEAIARAEGLDVDATFRLMRACTSFGLMTYDDHSGFSATPLLNTLLKDDPQSLRSTALAQPAQGHWLPLGRLSQSIKTGLPQATEALGAPVWDYYASAPLEANAFTESMNRLSTQISTEVANLIDTKNIGLVIDVGGAGGMLVQTLMEKNKSLHGGVFDLAHVLHSAKDAAISRGLQERFTAIAGDFFVDVPPADLFLLKWILHDWNDEACLSILRNCRRSVRPGGRIAVVEMIVEDETPAPFTSLADLTMLALLGGRERTLAEFDRLLKLAGFRISRVEPTNTPFSLIEAATQ